MGPTQVIRDAQPEVVPVWFQPLYRKLKAEEGLPITKLDWLDKTRWSLVFRARKLDASLAQMVEDLVLTTKVSVLQAALRAAEAAKAEGPEAIRAAFQRAISDPPLPRVRAQKPIAELRREFEARLEEEKQARLEIEARLEEEKQARLEIEARLAQEKQARLEIEARLAQEKQARPEIQARPAQKEQAKEKQAPETRQESVERGQSPWDQDMPGAKAVALREGWVIEAKTPQAPEVRRHMKRLGGAWENGNTPGRPRPRGWYFTTAESYQAAKEFLASRAPPPPPVIVPRRRHADPPSAKEKQWLEKLEEEGNLSPDFADSLRRMMDAQVEA